MYEIKSKRWLSGAVTEMRVYAPRIAESALPGQFLIVRVDEEGERIPLTICDYDAEEGTVTIVTQNVGLSSQKINSLEEGDRFADVVGPLGRPTDLMELSDEQLRAERILFVMIMMKFASLSTKKAGIPTVVSLNALMVDGTGMCGACRVTVGGETKFTCVDGPEFDAHKVDFDEAMRRQNMYRNNPKTTKCTCNH